MELVVHPGTLVICSLPPDSPWPAEPAGSDRAGDGAGYFSVTRTPTELSLVRRPGAVPPGAVVEPGWRALFVGGALDFGLVGILAGLSGTLAAAGVSIFVLSTFATDTVLVNEVDLDRAVAALTADGHTVTAPTDGRS